MTESSSPVDPLLRALGSLAPEHVPHLEVLLIDRLARQLVGEAAPGAQDVEDTADRLVQTLFECMAYAAEVPVSDLPRVGDTVMDARDRVVAGGRELAESGEQGVVTVISRATPTVIGQLQQHAGDPGAALHGAYLFLLLAVATGTNDKADRYIAEGLTASFDAWDQMFAAGSAPDWVQS